MIRARQAIGAAALLPRAASLIKQYGRPAAVLYFGIAPGDDVLATAVLRQWHRIHGTRPAYLTNHPSLFEGNPDVAWTAPYSPALAGALSLLGVTRKRLKYHDYDAAEDRSVGPAGHLIDLMCASVGLPATDDPTPCIFLRPDELDRPSRSSPRVAVQSSARSATMPIGNKDWYPERMQQVVDRLRPSADMVQLGLVTDPPLNGVTDLRGKTTLREAAAILSGASAFVGMVGFLMHLARGVGTPSVIVFGGREHPLQSGYAANENLFTAMECSPCWLWNRCPYDRECMQRITADAVVAAVERVLRHRAPAI
jgi:hypothetical protein